MSASVVLMISEMFFVFAFFMEVALEDCFVSPR